MADFCQQCSVDMWGRDTGDFAASTEDVHLRLHTLCEGCGPTVVDRSGMCMGDCLLKHGREPVLKLEDFIRSRK